VLLVTAGNETTRTAIAHAPATPLVSTPISSVDSSRTTRASRRPPPDENRSLGFAGDLDRANPSSRNYTLSALILKAGEKVVMFYYNSGPTVTKRSLTTPYVFDVGPNGPTTTSALAHRAHLLSRCAPRLRTRDHRDVARTAQASAHDSPTVRRPNWRQFINGIKHLATAFRAVEPPPFVKDPQRRGPNRARSPVHRHGNAQCFATCWRVTPARSAPRACATIQPSHSRVRRG